MHIMFCHLSHMIGCILNFVYIHFMGSVRLLFFTISMLKMWLLWIICIHCICCTAMIDIRFWNKPVPPQNKKTTTKKVRLSVVAFIFTNNWNGALWVLSSEQKLFLTLDLQNNFQLFSWLNFFLQPLRLIYRFLSRMDCNDCFLLGHSWLTLVIFHHDCGSSSQNLHNSVVKWN